MFKRILVAVDGSPASSAGLHSAVALAADQRAALIALHVIDDGSLPINFEGAVYPPSTSKRTPRRCTRSAAGYSTGRSRSRAQVLSRPTVSLYDRRDLRSRR